MICYDLQPYSVVDDYGFRNLINHLEPRYPIPKRKYFTENIIPFMYEKLLANLQAKLQNAAYISFTSDGWTANHNLHSFFSLTAHWINENFKPEQAVLQMSYFEGSHTGVKIGKFLTESLNKWNIEKKRIQMIVTDNAANMKLAIRESGLEDSSLGCVLHTLQLCIQDKILNEQRSVKDMLSVIRNLATHLNHSSSSRDALKNIQKELNIPQHALIQDVVTRWNSSYYKLKRIIEQKKAVVLFCIGKKHACPTDNQWELAESLVLVLEQFELATKEMSFNEASVSQVIPFIASMEKYLNYTAENVTGIKTILSEVSNNFKERFYNYKTEPKLMIATMLDPRFKLKYFITQEEKDKAKVELYSCYDQFYPKLLMTDGGTYYLS